MHNFTRPGGCREQMLGCQDRLRGLDVAAANRHAAARADDDCGIEPACEAPAVRLYFAQDVGWYDIAHPQADPFPPPHMHGYMADGAVLGALGSPVNFSASSAAVARNFAATHDEVHGGFLDAVAYLLDAGVKVHMMYGDRDYACNWVGGERASLAVPYSRAADFAGAGYAPLLAGDGGGVAGLTRQLGNYSFTRVFQAGHEVPVYQPAAAYEIFMRATFNRDIPTGLRPVGDELATAGPPDTWHVRSVPPPAPAPRCYVLAPGTCTPEVWARVVAGDVEVRDYFVVGGDSDEDMGEL